MKSILIKTNFVFNSQMFFIFGFFYIYLFLEFLNQRFSCTRKLFNLSFISKTQKKMSLFILIIIGDEKNDNKLLL